MRLFTDRPGFTLIEFLLVLSVIGILAAISISVISNSPVKMP
ncbi:MAG: prepilin-type N-terminal cleavage/methylation domain-containing protein [Desulfobulbaceae bacterium]|nr:prepilin-type N-terminal cleavage/methylation domain-containing protein [Desulfobulbaceae bacterium]